MSKDMTITDAFEVLQTAVEEAITAVQDVGSDAMRGGNFDAAERVIRQARILNDLRDQLYALQQGFEAHVVTSVEPESPHSRLQHGLKTPQEAYIRPILESLVELGGSANLNDVLDRVYARMRDQLNVHDHAPLPSDSKTPRWRNAAQWARNSLRSEGLLRGDSPRGVWEISEAGRQWLDENPPD